jgi:ribosomal protein S18 acetylase RimI-like enzyme
MSFPGLTFRPATRSDMPFVTPLIYDIGRRDLDRLFTGLAAGLSPLGIVERFCRAPGGMFSWHNTEIALLEGVPAGFITAYRAASRNGSFTWLARAAGQLGIHALVLLAWRGASTVGTLQRHLPGSWYVAFVGVDPLQQSLGIGSSLLGRSIQTARASGCSHVELDVNVDNPRAQALYERLGFHVLHADRPRTSSLMVETRRMVLQLQE